MRSAPSASRNLTQVFHGSIRLRVGLTLALLLLTFGSPESRAGSQSAQFLTDAILKSATPTSAPTVKDGPRIDHYFPRSGQIDVEKVTYPAPSRGQKVLVIALPKTNDGRIDLDHFQVSLSFTVKRHVDTCNKTHYQGTVEEHTISDRQSARYFKMTYLQSRIASTLKACLRDGSEIRDGKELRTVEVVTDLRNLRTFRDNLVLYVPDEVEVTAQVWKRAQSLNGIAP